MNGRGTLTHPSGAFYSDLFRDNMHHGKGTYQFPDGTEYTGTFNNNRGVHRLVWTGMFHNKAALGLKLKVNM
uniref:MORN repeat containing 2 n=1 Tax=Sinocyclocheilus anshuiensis TaxID=1608454 RepID=A0A671MPN8_9TELE